VGVAVPAPCGSVPTFGVALSRKFKPNWLLPCVEAVWAASAVIVLEPEVSVVPLTVILYPLPALVEIPICDVPLPVVLGVRVPRLTDEPVAPEQLLDVMPDVPVQNVRVSSTCADNWIGVDVLVATVPASIGVDQAASE
jgi:hypothetical protein